MAQGPSQGAGRPKVSHKSAGDASNQRLHLLKQRHLFADIDKVDEQPSSSATMAGPTRSSSLDAPCCLRGCSSLLQHSGTMQNCVWQLSSTEGGCRVAAMKYNLQAPRRCTRRRTLTPHRWLPLLPPPPPSAGSACPARRHFKDRNDHSSTGHRLHHRCSTCTTGRVRASPTWMRSSRWGRQLRLVTQASPPLRHPCTQLALRKNSPAR